MLEVVIVGGFAALDSYNLAGPSEPYPRIAADFAHSFAVWDSLRPDIFLGGHGLYFGMLAKLARMPAEGASVWVDPAGYRAAVAAARTKFEQQVAAQTR